MTIYDLSNHIDRIFFKWMWFSDQAWLDWADIQMAWKQKNWSIIWQLRLHRILFTWKKFGQCELQIFVACSFPNTLSMTLKMSPKNWLQLLFYSNKMSNILVLSIVFSAIFVTSSGHPVVPSLETIYDLEKISTNLQLFQRNASPTMTTTTTETSPMPLADPIETTEKPMTQVRVLNSEQLSLVEKLKSSKKSSKQKSDPENMSETLRKYVRLWKSVWTKLSVI